MIRLPFLTYSRTMESLGTINERTVDPDWSDPRTGVLVRYFIWPGPDSKLWSRFGVSRDELSFETFDFRFELDFLIFPMSLLVVILNWLVNSVCDCSRIQSSMEGLNGINVTLKLILSIGNFSSVNKESCFIVPDKLDP